MHWFNEYAPAIQALAALVSVIATIVLVRITANYVALTKDLVDNAKASLDLHRNEQTRIAEERKHQILSLILHLRMLATSLPGESNKAEAIRNVSLWSDAELQQLRGLAVIFGATVADLANEATRHLATLGELARKVQDTPKQLGVDWSQFPWDRWGQAHQGAERCLISVVRQIEDQH